MEHKKFTVLFILVVTMLSAVDFVITSSVAADKSITKETFITERGDLGDVNTCEGTLLKSPYTN